MKDSFTFKIENLNKQLKTTFQLQNRVKQMRLPLMKQPRFSLLAMASHKGKASKPAA